MWWVNIYYISLLYWDGGLYIRNWDSIPNLPPFRKVFSFDPVSNWKDMLGSLGSLKMKEAAITISILCYCDIHLIHLQRTLCIRARRVHQCAWPPQYLQQQIDSGVCVTKSMGIKFIEQLRLLFCYCSAFTKEGKNVSGRFNNSHRIAQHHHFVVYKGAPEGGIIMNSFFPLSLRASNMCNYFISIQMSSSWIIYCVLGLFYMQRYFKSAVPFCARAALCYFAALCSRMPDLWRSRNAAEPQLILSPPSFWSTNAKQTRPRKRRCSFNKAAA